MPDALLEAIDWVRQLEASSDEVKFDIAIRVRDGDRLPANHDVAFRWLRRSDTPEAKLESAVGKLSGRYGNRGVYAAYADTTKRTALLTIRIMAENGYAPAQRELGLHFSATEDFYAACVWLLVAEASGANIAGALSSTCGRLSLNDLQHATRLANKPSVLYLP